MILDKNGKEIEANEKFSDLFNMKLVGIGELKFSDPQFIKHEPPPKTEVDHVRDRGWWAK